MKQFFLKLTEWVAGSMDNHPGGASSKKLSAFFALVVMAGVTQFTWLVWAYKHDNWELLEYILTIDLMFAGTALGINAVEKIRGKNNPINEKTPT